MIDDHSAIVQIERLLHCQFDIGFQHEKPDREPHHALDINHAILLHEFADDALDGNGDIEFHKRKIIRQNHLGLLYLPTMIILQVSMNLANLRSAVASFFV